MAQNLNRSDATPAKNVVKVNVLRANVKQTKVIDTDIVFVLEDGRTVFIRDGAVQSLLDNGFSVEFIDGTLVSGQELLQSAGTAEISSVALTGPQASSNDGVIVVQAPQATVAPEAVKPSSGGGLKSWFAIGTPVVGGVLAGVLSGGGGSSSSTPTSDSGSNTVKPATPVINVIANDDKVNATEKADGVSVTGTSEATASVTVIWGNTTKTVTADSTGRWSASFASGEVPADAPATTISATVKSAAGVSSDPATKTVQIDTTPPGAPVIANVAGDNVIGPTEKASGVNINGTAEAGSTVSVGFGGINKTVAADMGGNWSVNYTASEIPVAGNYAVTASARDANGNIGSSPASRPIVVSAAVNVMGQIVAGPVIVGNGLSVDIYLANGTLLVSGIRVNSDGSFTAANLPIDAGDVIIAKVVDSTTGPDYLDEATGVAKDLNAVLLAVKTVEGTTVTMNINPLTTVAAIKAGLAADGSGTVANAAAATNANKATAQAFGLADIDITTTSVVATNSGGFDATDQLSSGEKIGAVLAALSGLDNLNGGNSQATVVAISQLLNVDGSKGQLSDQGQVRLMDGAIAAEDTVNGTLQNFISNGLASSSSTTQVTINAIATDNIITANEVANLTVSGTVSSSVTGVSVLLGTRTATAKVTGTDWSYTLSADDLAALGADGPVVIKAQAALPNAASVISTRVVTLKTAPPAAPSLNVVSGDNAINGSEKTVGVAFSGTSEVGSTVFLTFGNVTKNVLVGATRTWTLAFLASEIPADGTSTVSVSARDAFGNSSGTVTRPILIDTIAPSLPTIRPVTGDDVIGPTEKVGGVQIQGTADALATIRLTLGDIVRTATADASGNWSVSFLNSQVPNDGDYALTVTQSDVAGNVSAEATRTVRVDAQPPARPIILPVATDNIINAAEKLNGVTLRGTAEPNVSIELNWGAISRTIRASASGTWSAFFTGAQIPTDGSSDVTATATDSSGNISETATRTVTIDSINQNLIILSVATDDIINAAEKASNVVVTGEAEPGSSVVVTLGGTSRETLADQDGFWVTNFTTNEIPADTVTSTVTARSTDRAGNVSVLVEYDIGIDTVRPNAPVFNIVAGDNVINANEATAAVEISGTAEAFSLVTVNWGTATRTANVDADGNWRTVFPASQIPPEGASVVYATATDDAKNISVTAEHHVLIDLGTVRPVINTIAGNDVINAAERTNGVLVTGTAEAGATVRLVWGTVIKNPVADQDGNWSQLFIASEIPLSGNATITATPTDINGNVGATSLPKNFTIDTQALPAVFDNVTGPDNIVNASEKSLGVSVTGTAEVGSTVLITWGATVKSVTVDASGVWTTFFTSSQMPADGATSITAVVTDLAGNVSVQSGQPVTIDTVPPLAPIITIPIAGDGVVNNTERSGGVVVAGTAEAHADVTIAWGTTSSKTVRADAAGVWTATFVGDEINPVGSATISVSQRDVAGNSGPAATATVIVNTGAPSAPFVSAVATNDVVNALAKASGVTISGTALGQSTVSVNWGITKTVTAAANGNWSVTFAADEVPADGSPTVTVFQTDTLGNVSPSTSRVITVDTMPPAVPEITTPIAGNNIINAAEKNAAVTISGTAPNSTTLEVRISGIVKTVTSNSAGVWSVTFASDEIPADAAGVLIEARTIDTAGNPSAWVGKSVDIDATLPATPVISTVAGDDVINATERAGNITVNGTAEANAAVRVTWNGFVRDVSANNLGEWSAIFLNAELPSDGSSVITARATDAAGNANAVNGTRSVTTLTTPPALPVINQVATDDTINIAERAAGVTVTGTASANAKVAVTFGTTTHVVDANATGDWSALFTTSQIAAEGLSRPITAVQTDVYGNVSGTTARNVAVDLTAPTNLTINQTGGSDQTINAAEKAASVLVSGTTDVGNRVLVTWGGVEKSVTSNNGTWSVSYAANEVPADTALSTISVTAQDAAGNISSVVTQNVRIDSTIAAPVINIVSDNDRLNATEALNPVTISGKAEANATVRLRWGETAERTLTADANGNWSTSYAVVEMPPEGINAVTARQTDVAGNISAQASRSVEIDTVQPPTPVITGMSNDYGNYGDFATDRNSVVLTGSGVANGLIELYVNGTYRGFATVDSAGLWESPVINLAALSFGSTVTATVKAFDAAGNANAADASVVITKQAVSTTPIDVTNMPASAGFTFAGALFNGFPGGLAMGNIGGDSHKDLILSNVNLDTLSESLLANRGGVTVVYGRSSWAGVSVYDLMTAGTNGWVLVGAAFNDALGHGGAGVIGDLNGDGFGELIAGAINADNGGIVNAGAAYIVWGSSTPLGTLPVNPSDGNRYIKSVSTITPAEGFVFRGLTTNENLGNATLGISTKFAANTNENLKSDFNGDGIADFFIASRNFDRPAIGAQTAADNVGATIVVFGRTDRVYGNLNPTTGQQEMTINDLTADKGFIIRGLRGDSSSGSIASAGDVNGDGVTDLLIGSRYSDRPGSPFFGAAGAAYVVYGKKEGQTWSSLSDDPGMPGRKVLDLANLQASDGFMIMGEAQDGELGRSVEGLGDVNGDGIDDFIVAAPVSTVNGVAQVGKAFVIFGSRSGQGDLIGLRQVLSITDMRSNQGFIIQGVSDTLGLKGRLGESVGAAGDVNGDGLADIIVNAPYLDKGTAVDVGRSYIIYGKNNGDGWGQIVGTQSILDLNNFGPEDGFSIVGKNAGDNLGATPGIGEGDSSIIAPGDLNNDGIDDLYLNLTYSDPFNRANAGEGLFVYGTPGRGGMSLSGSTGANVLSGGGLADVITGLGGEDRLRGFGGNDTLIVSDASFVRVDGGTGTDTLRLAGATGFGLNLSTITPGAIKDIEQIDLVAGSLNNTLTITQQTLLDLSSTSDLLRVFGDNGDIVNVTGFVSGSSVTDKGVTYNIFTSGAATLWVQNGVTVVGATPPPSGFVAPAFAWAEHAVLAA